MESWICLVLFIGICIIISMLVTNFKENIKNPFGIVYVIALTLTISMYIYRWDWNGNIVLNILMLPIASIVSSIVIAWVLMIPVLIFQYLISFIKSVLSNIKNKLNFKFEFDNWHIWGYITLICLIYIVLFVGLLDFEDNQALYTFLRWFVMIFCICSFYKIYSFTPASKNLGILGLIGVLFNPIAPIHLEKEVWFWIDLIIALYFTYLLFRTRNT